MSKKIGITADNYRQCAPIQAAAIYISEPGAQGGYGRVVIVSELGDIFFYNYIYGSLSAEQISELCPILLEVKLNICGQGDITPNGWTPLYLGMGNHLFVSESFKDAFIDELVANGITSGPCVYREWLRIIIGILKGKESDSYESIKSFPDECFCEVETRGKRNPNIEKNLNKMFEGPFTIEELLQEG